MSIRTARDGQPTGVWEVEALQAAVDRGEVLPADLIWTTGFEDWKQLSVVAHEIGISLPVLEEDVPPIPGTATQVPPIPSTPPNIESSTGTASAHDLGELKFRKRSDRKSHGFSASTKITFVLLLLGGGWLFATQGLPWIKTKLQADSEDAEATSTPSSGQLKKSSDYDFDDDGVVTKILSDEFFISPKKVWPAPRGKYLDEGVFFRIANRQAQLCRSDDDCDSAFDLIIDRVGGRSNLSQRYIAGVFREVPTSRNGGYLVSRTGGEDLRTDDRLKAGLPFLQVIFKGSHLTVATPFSIEELPGDGISPSRIASQWPLCQNLQWGVDVGDASSPDLFKQFNCNRVEIPVDRELSNYVLHLAGLDSTQHERAQVGATQAHVEQSDECVVLKQQRDAAERDVQANVGGVARMKERTYLIAAYGLAGCTASERYNPRCPVPSVDTESPEACVFDPPSYPPEEQRRGVQGTAVLVASIDEAGVVVDAQVEQSSGNRNLDREAIKTVRNWYYSPAVSGGKPVASRVRVPVKFSLQGNASGSTNAGEVSGQVASQPEPEPNDKSSAGFVVQVGAFPTAAAATSLRDSLRGAGFTAFTDTVSTNDGMRIRVRVGPVRSRADADALNAAIKARIGLEGAVRPHP